MTSDPWAELERLVREVPEPFDELHTTAKRLLLQATDTAPKSTGLSAAIDEFHAELEFLTLLIEMYGRDSFDQRPEQDSCLNSMQVVRAIYRHSLN